MKNSLLCLAALLSLCVVNAQDAKGFQAKKFAKEKLPDIVQTLELQSADEAFQKQLDVYLARRAEVLNSIESLSESEKERALTAWSDEAERLRPKPVRMESEKSEAEMEADAKEFRKKSLDSRISLLEERVAERANPEFLRTAKKSSEASREDILARFDEINLRKAKAQRALGDIDFERQHEFELAWLKSADGKLFSELGERLQKIESEAYIEGLKTEIAQLRTKKVSRIATIDGETDMDGVLLAIQERRLADAEFFKTFEALPESQKATALEAHRKNQDVKLQALKLLQKEINLKKNTETIERTVNEKQ
jgi:hypothetical protein